MRTIKVVNGYEIRAFDGCGIYHVILTKDNFAVFHTLEDAEKFCNSRIYKTDMIHLQGVGLQPAIKASELKIGTKIMWNYGKISEVKDVEFSKTGKTLNVRFASGGCGKFRADRLVAVA